MRKKRKQREKTAEMQERIAKEGFCNVFESLGRKERRTSGFVQPAYLNATYTEPSVTTSSTTTKELLVVKTDYYKIQKKLDSYDRNQKIEIWNRIIGERHPNRFIHKNTREELLKCIPSIEEFFNCITASPDNQTEYAKYLYRNTCEYFVIDVDKYKHINYLRTFDFMSDSVPYENGFLAVFDKEYLIQQIMSCPDSLDLFTK